MADNRTETPTRNNQTAPTTTRAVARSENDSQGMLMESDQGKTAIADGVVAKIAGIAAREVDGVHDLTPMGAGAAIAGIATRITRGDQRASGVSVEVGQREAAVDLNMTVNYGVSIPQVALSVRQNIMARVREMTGLTVKEVNINVADLYFADDQTQQQPPRVQ